MSNLKQVIKNCWGKESGQIRALYYNLSSEQEGVFYCDVLIIVGKECSVHCPYFEIQND